MLAVHSLPCFRKLDWVSWACVSSLSVESSTQAIDNPLHEAAKRGMFDALCSCTNCNNGYCVFAFTGNLPFLQECISNRVRPCPASTTITLSSLSSRDYHVFPPSTHLNIHVIHSSCWDATSYIEEVTHLKNVCNPLQGTYGMTAESGQVTLFQWWLLPKLYSNVKIYSLGTIAWPGLSITTI